MMRRRSLVAALAVLAVPAVRAQASVPPELAGVLPGARLQGQALMRFFGLRVYEARLWTGAVPVGADWNLPLALELEYARSLEGKAVAGRSLDEMRRQGEITAADAERWLAEMTRLFPDVKQGDRLTGVHEPGRGARFFFNGSLRGEVADPRFAHLFFGIWLAPQTSEPALRESLLGPQRPNS